MPSKEFKLPSGATLLVTRATFEESDILLKALLREARGLKLDGVDVLDLDVAKPAEALQKGGTALFTQLLDRALSLAASKEVSDALFTCFVRASYNGQRITKGLFDDEVLGEQAREDYFTICLKVIEVNCGPFFKKTFSRLSAPGTAVKSTATLVSA